MSRIKYTEELKIRIFVNFIIFVPHFCAGWMKEHKNRGYSFFGRKLALKCQASKR